MQIFLTTPSKPKTLPAMQMLRDRLDELNLSQREAARQADVPETYLSDILSKRRRMGVKTARKLSKALNISLDDLLGAG